MPGRMVELRRGLANVNIYACIYLRSTRVRIGPPAACWGSSTHETDSSRGSEKVHNKLGRECALRGPGGAWLHMGERRQRDGVK
eukprot:1150359-Pelagomonas_calceolata.AAC.2